MGNERVPRASLDVTFGWGGMAAARAEPLGRFLPSLQAAQSRHRAVRLVAGSHRERGVGSGVTLFVVRARAGGQERLSHRASGAALLGAVLPRAARCKTEPEGFAGLTACSTAA